MSLRPRRRSLSDEDRILTDLRAVDVPLVRALDADERAISPRAVCDAVADLPEVARARAWASGDAHRADLVRFTVAGLTSRCYAASCDALERSRV
jgi:hypothetical protein